MSAKKKILIIDDDASVRVSLALLLKQAGYETFSAENPQQALTLLRTRAPDLVLQDMNFSLKTSGEEGLELLTQIKQTQPAVPVLLMTAWGSIALAVKGVKAGAADFFTKPWQNDQLVQLVTTTLDLSASFTCERQTRQLLDQHHDFNAIVGEHPDLLRVLVTVARVAKSRAPVLILGESGTGKEMIANAIHHNSPRAQQALVKVNMGAVTSSLFESEMFGHVKGAFTDAKTHRKGHFVSANHGTLFLDEIGELNKSDQVKLLRVMQDQHVTPVGASHGEPVDVRIVSATNRELAGLVASGEFREDLFYRLNLITLRLPALRERRSDIPVLARQLSAQLATEYQMPETQLSASALEWLSAQPWPGNIRQLKQCLERSVLLSNKTLIDSSDLMQSEQVNLQAEYDSGGEIMPLFLAEKQLLERALDHYHGNISHIAKSLGLSRAAVYRRLSKHGLHSNQEGEG